ncbi:MAG: glyoxalase/bleomycin resistance/dioxygenase family protein [Saccharospirillaceae bacterium]|nr:hypothetical protein [Pseudomonadales bacterium]NRB77817.1 glyoxalase/bleomycin resistance/dioxygenase family protein [Saccharospirillaceae bacterium]
MIKIERTGIILHTQNYEQCVAFYRDILELKIEILSPDLTSFDFGGAYLMVEREGEANLLGKTKEQNPTVLRMNVVDVKQTTQLLRDKDVVVDYVEFDWGTVARFMDPDGNFIEFKDSEKFDLQIKSN